MTLDRAINDPWQRGMVREVCGRMTNVTAAGSGLEHSNLGEHGAPVAYKWNCECHELTIRILQGL